MRAKNWAVQHCSHSPLHHSFPAQQSRSLLAQQERKFLRSLRPGGQYFVSAAFQVFHATYMDFGQPEYRTIC